MAHFFNLFSTLLFLFSVLHASFGKDLSSTSLPMLTGTVNLTTFPNTLFDPSRTKLVLTNDGTKSEHYFNSKGEFSIPLADNKSKYTLALESLDFRFKQTNQFRIIVNNDNDNDNEIRVFQLNPGLSYESNSDMVPCSLHFQESQLLIRNYADEDQSNSLWNYVPMGHYIKQNPIIGYCLLGMVGIILLPQLLSYVDPEFAQRANEARSLK